MNNLITFSNVTKSFSQENVVFTNFSFLITQGESVSFIGKSGCGKSTILRLIAGLEDPDNGKITVLEMDPKKNREKGNINFAFQDPILLPWLSVEENISLPFKIAPNTQDKSTANQRVSKLINAFKLYNDRKKKPNQLSGGTAVRTGLARALAKQAPILLLDEPFSSLDEITRNELNGELKAYLKKDATITTVMVTHSLDEALFLTDKIILLSNDPQNKKVSEWNVNDVVKDLNLESLEQIIDSKPLLSIKKEILIKLKTTC